MNKSNKILRIIIAILFFTLIIALVFKLAGRLVLESDFGAVGSGPSSDPYKQYTASLSQAAPGSDMYYFKLENLNGALTASASGTEGGTYYSIDIVLGMKNKKEALQFQNNPDLLASVIRDTMAGFKSSDLTNEKGREYLKSQLKYRVASTFNISNVDEIYFEKFLFQNADLK